MLYSLVISDFLWYDEKLKRMHKKYVLKACIKSRRFYSEENRKMDKG